MEERGEFPGHARWEHYHSGGAMDEVMDISEKNILVPGSDRICKVCVKRKSVHIGSKVRLGWQEDAEVAEVTGIHRCVWDPQSWRCCPEESDKFYF